MAEGVERFLEHARTAKALVVGDVMVDLYLKGHVERISPEAPVPVVQVHERQARSGGAANVALNMNAFGVSPLVLSVIGDDDAATTLERLFKEQGLRTTGLLRSPKRRTTMKTRVISGHQHIVRVDEEQEDDLNDADQARLVDAVRKAILSEKPDVVVMEDYDKGVLTERVITEVIKAAGEADVPVAVDPKKRNFLSYRNVDLFKPNLKELREGLKIDVDPSDLDQLRNAVLALMERSGIKSAMITLSEHGAYIHSDGVGHHVDAHRRKIADVSGAGDTVIAVAALALGVGLPPKHILELANLAGGLVCEEVGVVPVDVERFVAECKRLNLPS